MNVQICKWENVQKRAYGLTKNANSCNLPTKGKRTNE